MSNGAQRNPGLAPRIALRSIVTVFAAFAFGAYAPGLRLRYIQATKTSLLQYILNRIQRRLRTGFVLIAGRAAHAYAADMFTARGDDRQSAGEGRRSRHQFQALVLRRDLAEFSGRERDAGSGIRLHLRDFDADQKRTIHTAEMFQLAAVVDDGNDNLPAFGFCFRFARGSHFLRRRLTQKRFCFLRHRDIESAKTHTDEPADCQKFCCTHYFLQGFR